jgi:hypothetical protein
LVENCGDEMGLYNIPEVLEQSVTDKDWWEELPEEEKKKNPPGLCQKCARAV